MFFLDGWIEEGLGHNEQALELYQRHLEFHASDLAARARLVPLLARLERWKEAYRESQPLAAARPGDRMIEAMLADLAFRSGHCREAEQRIEALGKQAGDDRGGGGRGGADGAQRPEACVPPTPTAGRQRLTMRGMLCRRRWPGGRQPAEGIPYARHGRRGARLDRRGCAGRLTNDERSSPRPRRCGATLGAS
jgi:hypothetical protein